jgi:hypothetical protein
MNRSLPISLLLALVLAIPATAQLTGPAPYSDPQAYGQAVPPSLTKANTSSGDATIKLASAANFKNGQYITIFNSGVPCSLSAPSAPTVKPSVNSGGLNTVPSNAGSSSYAYVVVAADKFGCYTTASSSGSTSTGTALGRRIVSISKLARSNNVVTVTTSASHGLVAGELILINYFSTTDPTFEGYWIVRSAVDSKHFTFQSSMDTRTGATTSATGGTLYGYDANHITWTAVRGAWKYYIYGRTSGAYNLLGQTLDTFYNDYGSPMNDNQKFPSYLPSTPPSSGANDHLTAKIVSGGGTTTLTLASKAGATLSGVAAKSDDGPALVAAASVANQNGYPMQISSPLTINSYTQLNRTAYGYKINLLSSIQTNDTLEFGGNTTITGISAPPPAAFAWEGTSAITGPAYPLITHDSGSNLFQHVALVAQAQNGYLLLGEIARDSNVNDSFDYVTFHGGEGQSNDYIGMLAIFQTGGFSFRFNKCLFTTGAAGGITESYIGYSPLPSVVFLTRSDGTPTGNWIIEHSWFLYRGAFLQDYTGASGGVSYGYVKDIQTQNLTVPLLQWTNAGFFGSGNLEIEGITPADFPTAMVANFTPYYFTGVSVLGTTQTQGNHNVFTGNPFAGVSASSGAVTTGINSNMESNSGWSTAVDGVFNSQPTGSTVPVAQSYFNATMVLGNSYSLFTDSPSVAAPTCSVSSGGSVAIGTYKFAIAPVFWNGGVGAFGPASTNCTTTSGNQTITIKWTAVIGAEHYYLAEKNGSGSFTGPLPPNNNCAAPSAYMPGSFTSYIWNGISSLGSCGGSLPTGVGGGPTMLNSTGLSAPQMRLEPRPFSSLGTPADGVIIFCSDCTTTNPCARGGAGAYAKGLRGVWVCN